MQPLKQPFQHFLYLRSTLKTRTEITMQYHCLIVSSNIMTILRESLNLKRMHEGILRESFLRHCRQPCASDEEGGLCPDALRRREINEAPGRFGEQIVKSWRRTRSGID